MNLLYPGYADEGAGKTVVVDNLLYPINYQYYYILKIIAILEDEKLSDEQRYAQILRYFYADAIPENVEAGLQACFKFILVGNYQPTSRKNSDKQTNSQPLYDYQQDHQLIFASMCQAYGNSWRSWHWWEWKAAFDNLPENTPIRQVISIRARKFEPKMSPKERANLQELKELYSLNQVSEKIMTPAEIEAEILARD